MLSNFLITTLGQHLKDNLVSEIHFLLVDNKTSGISCFFLKLFPAFQTSKGGNSELLFVINLYYEALFCVHLFRFYSI
jgi:hypothetical protein